MAILGRSNIDEGDKIILPASTLDVIAQMNVEYPLLFELSNSRTGKSSHCGVLEFSAEEGRCYMPFWMMENLGLTEGVIVNIRNTSLSKASFVKFKPQSVDFLEISNPRVALETALRKFTCLTIGDIINIRYSGKVYRLLVKELKPNNAVSIVETDCEVDFDEPEGYKESKYYEAEVKARERARTESKGSFESRPIQKAKLVDDENSNKLESQSFKAFAGVAQRIDGKLNNSNSNSVASSTNTSVKSNAANAALARANNTTTSQSITNNTNDIKPPIYQSKIGDKYSKLKTSTTAFIGSANKLK
eukprot:gene17609-23183_t